jgi:PAS domain S-box-containing protein
MDRRQAAALWLGLGLVTATILFALDVALGSDVVLITSFAAAPFVAAAGASPRQTAIAALYSFALGVAAGPFDEIFGDLEYFARLVVLVILSAIAIRIASIRTRRELGSDLQHVVADTLASAPTLSEATPKILRSLGSVLDWEVGAIWAPDEEGTELRCVETWQAAGVDLEEFAARTRGISFPPGAVLPGRVWSTGKPLWIGDVAHDPDIMRAEAAERARLRGGVGFPITGSGGVRGVIEFFSRAERPPNGYVLGLLDVIGSQLGQYIERRTAEEAARRSESLRGAVVESALDSVIVMDHSGCVVEFSRSAEQTFGYPRDDAIGNELAELIVPPGLRERHRAGIKRYMEEGFAPILDSRIELTAMRADGSEFPVEVSITRVGDQDPPLFAGYLRDITERRQAEREREALLARERTARLRAESLERRSTFLVELQAALDASFDYELSLRKLARLLVSRVADWCAIHVLQPDGTVALVAVEHSDPAKRELAWSLEERYPIDVTEPEGIAKVVRTGIAELHPEIPDELIDATAHDAEHAAIVRGVGLRSAMIVPLKARGQILGAIAFASAESERRFDEEDLEFAKEVAGRAALSIDNARLYGEVQTRQVELEFLARATVELDSALDLERTLQRLPELTVPFLADGCMVDLLEGDRIKRLAIATSFPSAQPVLQRLKGHELDLDGPHPIAVALRTGKTQTVDDVTDSLRETWASDEGYLHDIREWPGRAAVVAPMRARGRTLGAIALASFSERKFGQRDIQLIEELARRAAVAVDNARLYSERSYIASKLQQSLLPPHLPEVPGVEIAARFRPAGEANEVGGDFYDIYRTGDRRWAIVMGDVCGKGADAAAVTALARYTLRAGMIGPDQGPDDALQHLNEALVRQVRPDRFCTVAYVELELGEATPRIRVASGGHPIPVVLRSDGRTEEAGIPGTLLGVIPDPYLPVAELELHPGDSLVLYTDGLTDVRTAKGDFGTERLMAALAKAAGRDAGGIVLRIETSLERAQVQLPRDDIAILVAQVSAHPAQAIAPTEAVLTAGS